MQQQSPHHPRPLTKPHTTHPLPTLPLLPNQSQNPFNPSLFPFLPRLHPPIRDFLSGFRLEKPRAVRPEFLVAEVGQHAWTGVSLKGGVEEDEFEGAAELRLEGLALRGEDGGRGAAAVEAGDAREGCHIGVM